MPKTTDENENILENKLKFIGLNLKRLPSFLKDFEPLNFKPTKSHDDINYKIYKYINVLDIEILLTPLDRTADLEQRYKKAEPLCNYLDTKNKKNAEKFETFMEMLDNLNTEDIEKLDEEQENLNETIPLKVKYENNYIWQIYYAPESNKYFMLVPTTELTSVALFYLIKKQIESKKNKKKFYIFVPITHMEYSGNLYTSLQITDLENYLWYFTKEWPTIFEIFDKKENSTIRVVGKAKVYDNIVSDYIMNFTQKDECIEKYKLLKALFLLSTSFQNDYSFKTAIGEDGELEFKYNSEVINYENLPEFIKSQAKERTDEIKNIIKERIEKLKPTAILAVNEPISINVVQALGELNLKIPEDISLIIYDDLSWATAYNISTIAHAFDSVGSQVCQVIMRRIKLAGTGQEIEPIRLVIDPELISRGSVSFHTPISTE